MSYSNAFARSFLRFLFGNKKSPIRRQEFQARRKSIRLNLDSLESRLVPTTITRTSSPVFYNDLKNDLTSSYASYQITNNDGVDYGDVWATIGNFRSASGAVVVNAGSNAATKVHIGSLVKGETKTAFFYLESNDTNIAASQIHSVTVFQGTPETGKAIEKDDFSFDKTSNDMAVDDTIKANANKVTSVKMSTDKVPLGGTFTITVTGDTGEIGKDSILAFSPASNKDWHADAFQMMGSSIVFSGGNNGTFNNTLFIPKASLTSLKDTHYVATYSFMAVAKASSKAAPVAYISSGQNVKHTAIDDENGDDCKSEIETDDEKRTVSLSQSVTPGSLTSAGKVTYTLVFNNTGDSDITLDRIVNTLPSSPDLASYVSGSANLGETPFSDPAISGQVLTWSGLFVIPAKDKKTFVFQANIPGTAGDYTNQAVGYIGDQMIGSSGSDDNGDDGENNPSQSTVTVTASAPPAPSTPDMTPGTDTGSSNTDNITSNNRPVFTGTATPGSTVKLYDGNTLIGSGTADSNGNYLITSNALSNGNHNIAATATVGSQVSPLSGVLPITIDTTAPNAPSVPDMTAATDTGLSNSDNITSIQTPRFTGTAEANSIVKLYDGSNLIGTGNADSSGNYSILSNVVLSNGVHSVSATSTDNAGNVSSSSGALSVTIDTVAPSAPAISQVNDNVGSITGVVANGGFTDDVTPTIRVSLSGTGAVAGDQVQVYQGNSPLGSVISLTSVDISNGYVELTPNALAQGTYSFSAKVTDVAGNISPTSAGYSVTIDTTAPSAPTITQVADDVAPIQGNVFENGKTDDNTPTIRVTLPVSGSLAVAGDSVQFYNGVTPVGAPVVITAAAITAGYIDITTPTLADGAYSIKAKITDKAGNESAPSNSFAFTVDTVLPGAFLQGSVFVDANNNGVFDLNEQALAGAVVKVYSADGLTLLGQVTTGPTGSYLFSDENNLLPGVKLVPGATYKIVETAPVGYATGVTASNQGIYTVLGSDSQSFTVQTLDPKLSSPNPLSLTFTSLPGGALTSYLQLNGSTINEYLTLLNVQATGGSLSAPRNFVSYCVDQPHMVSPGDKYPVLPVGATSSIDGISGQSGRIAFIYNHFGQNTLDPVHSAALQLAILELTFDSTDDLFSGNLQYVGPSGWTSASEGTAIVAACQAYLNASVGKSEPALYLDASIGGQSVPIWGRQGQLVAQNFSFGNYQVPVFTNTNTATYTYGQPVNFTFTASANPTFSSASLPAGLTLSSSGVLTGTPAVGTYTFPVTAFNGASAVQNFTLIVKPATLTVSGITANNKVYDGNTTDTLNTSGAQIQGLFGSDVVTLGFTGVTANFADKNVGDGKLVTIGGISLGGKDAGNYLLTQPTATANITPAGLTITAKSVTGTYGQVSLNPASGFTSTGLMPGDSIDSVTLTTDATLSSSGNFNYRANPWAITPSAPVGAAFSSGNYNISYLPGSLTINQKAINVINVAALNKQYDATTKATLSWGQGSLLGGIVANDDIQLDTSLATGNFASAHAIGNQPVTITGYTLTGVDAGNYIVPSSTQLTAKITPKIIPSVDISGCSTAQPYGDPAELNPVMDRPLNQAGSVFYKDKLDVSCFNTSFQFQTKTLTRSAGDGITFVIQNDGVNALGANGEGLGYQGIGKSVAIKIDLLNNYGEGTNSLGVYTGGENPSKSSRPSTPLSPFGFFFDNNHVFQMDLKYDGKDLHVTISDLTARLIYKKCFAIDIPNAVGDQTNHQAYVGFTGGTGTMASRQSILNWSLTDGTSSHVIDYPHGFNDASKLVLNGNAVVRGNPQNPTSVDGELVLTCPNKAFDLSTGVNSETLPVILSSIGNTTGSDVGGGSLAGGKYQIDGHWYDGTGLATDYQIQSFTGGTLTVTPRAVTRTIEDQTQTYDSHSNLLDAINNRRVENYYNQAGSAYYNTPVDISADFTTAFTFQSKALTSVGADGITFVIQGKGAGALGSSGEGLGYAGIQKSVAIKFDSFNNAGEGRGSTGIYYGGANPSTLSGSVDLSSKGIDFSTDHDFQASLSYNSVTHVLSVTITDLKTGVSATQTYNVDLGSKILCNQAYVGFTGATGTQASEQSIKSWKFDGGSTHFDYADFSNPQPLIVNGSAACNFNSKSLVLTGNNPGQFIETGVNGEHLGLYLTTTGNDVGNYTLNGALSDDDNQFGYSRTGALNLAGNTGKVRNYDVTLRDGSIRIKEADLIITAPTQTLTYGSNALLAPSVNGLKNGDTIGSIVLDTNSGRSSGGFYRASSLDANNGYSAIPWEVYPSKPTGGTFNPSNYNINYVNGQLTVLRSSLTITAKPQTKTYGDTFPFTGKEITSAGLLTGDLINYVDLNSPGTKSSANVGNYPITAGLARGEGLDNYNITYFPNTFTVTPKNLVVNIGDRTQSAGSKVQLNDNTPNPDPQVGSVFCSTPVDITSFSTTFRFQISRVDSNLGEGFTFTIQGNDDKAIGAKWAGLGYEGIKKSICVKFDVMDNEGEGTSSTGLYLNGERPTTHEDDLHVVNGQGIDLQDLHSCKAIIQYKGRDLTVEIDDEVTGKNWKKTYHDIDIQGQCGGSNCYVGFTGCTGGTAKQQILSWNFTPGSGAALDYSSGFAGARGLTLNGSALNVDGALTLTDQNFGCQILGANNETLFLFLTSNGNRADAAVGTYVLTWDGTIYNGTGLRFNYSITVNNGNLKVV